MINALIFYFFSRALASKTPRPPDALVNLSKRACHDVKVGNGKDFAKLVGPSLGIWLFSRVGVGKEKHPPDYTKADTFLAELGPNDFITSWASKTLVIYKKEKGFQISVNSLVKYLRSASGDVNLQWVTGVPAWNDGLHSGGSYPDLRGWAAGAKICAGAYWEIYYLYSDGAWHISSVEEVDR